MAEMLEASLARERALSIEIDALALKIQILAREFELLKNSFRQSLN